VTQDAPVRDPRAAVLDLASDAAMPSVVRAAVRALLWPEKDRRMTERDIDEVCLALQEACTNALRHGNRHDASKRVRVDVIRADDRVEIQIADEGEAFNPDDTGPIRPEELHESGYGIHIMRSWMDEVEVRHDGRGNIVRLVRHHRIGVSAPEASGAGRD